ncbi:MAG: histidinol dehydrogenase [Oscillospiraceae bacterium]|nr:histidinol dehydrogenase [Oscillospiraceae bacterium]
MRFYDLTDGGTLGADLEGLNAFIKDRGALCSDSGHEGAGAAVDAIVADVRSRGDAALLDYLHRFDGVPASEAALRLGADEMAAAADRVPAKLLGAMREAAGNIREFHRGGAERSTMKVGRDGLMAGTLVRPVRTAGLYVPAGAAPLFSTALMLGIPAIEAGVGRIYLMTPPEASGKVSDAILAAACIMGIGEVYVSGGAQAIAAMAYGTATVPAADVIAGPGGLYTTLAKKKVYGVCGVDMLAGPSDVTVIADAGADGDWVVADMLSQAEHDALASSVLITDSRELAGYVRSRIFAEAERLPRGEVIARSLEGGCAIVLVRDVREAVAISDMLAPEHLELCVADPMGALGLVGNAGTVFLGHYSPEPMGDYVAGPSHVLPTSGTARYASSVGVGTFMKRTNVVSYSKEAFGAAMGAAIEMAEGEGMHAHAHAIKVRGRVMGGPRGGRCGDGG